MKVSELWLSDYFPLPHSLSEIGEQLTHAGLEVDGMEILTDPSQQVLTLKIPANRGDCLSIEGIVREIALLNQLTFKEIPTVPVKTEIKDTIQVNIHSSQLCPRYVGRVISNIDPTIATPNWLKERLEWVGVRPISLIVDISNYVMLEIGQPLHAFDLAKIQGSIEVRLAKSTETLVLLDGKEVKLDPETLIIADEKGPLAIAGIMGGLDSGISDTTQTIFIESAYFNPISVRLSAKRLSIISDASYRFEREVDPALQIRAIERMTDLLLECSQAKAGPLVEIKAEAHLPKNPNILLRRKRIKDILGIELSSEQVQTILQRAYLDCINQAEDFLVTAPSFRHDIQLEIDIIEEIARIVGFNQIPSLIPTSPLVYRDISEKKISTDRLKQILIDRGFSEIISYSFIAPKWQSLLQSHNKVSLKNPLSSEMSVMRMSLLPGLLQAVQHNQRRQQDRCRFFEIGHVFLEENGERIEKVFLSGICSGSRFKEQWGASTVSLDFYDIKQDVEALIGATALRDQIEYKSASQPFLHPGQSAWIMQGEQSIGLIGALHPQLLKSLDLQEPVYIFEIECAKLCQVRLPVFQLLSKFPAIRRDLAILIDAQVFASTIKSAIVKWAGEWLQDVSIFDVYQGKGIEPGKKSIALSLVWQHPARTLVDTEINVFVQNVLTALSTEFKATLRE